MAKTPIKCKVMGFCLCKSKLDLSSSEYLYSKTIQNCTFSN